VHLLISDIATHGMNCTELHREVDLSHIPSASYSSPSFLPSLQIFASTPTPCSISIAARC
jgi:hypothetical protein